MTLTAIGRRVELVAMDTRFHDISLGLYAVTRDDRPAYLIHTYSTLEGAGNRVAWLTGAMAALGGMTALDEATVAFHCEEAHQLMARRIFLETTKLPPDADTSAKPLHIVDPKTGCSIRAVNTGDGGYVLEAEGVNEDCHRRAAVVTRGLTRITDAELVDGTSDRVEFTCGADHDAAIGLVLSRAINVRAAMREVEDAASRGVLAAPSSQSS